MEFQVRAVIGVKLIPRRRTIHALHKRAQIAHVGGAGSLRDTPAGELVERGPQLVDLVGFLDADLAHENAAILLEPDQARLLERPECLAHRAARHAEHVGNGGFVELGAGAELAGQDPSLELALHQHGQRVGLEEGDGAVRGSGAAGRARHGRGQSRGSRALGFQHVAIRRPDV